MPNGPNGSLAADVVWLDAGELHLEVRAPADGAALLAELFQPAA
jgi:hypothetical protein